MTDQNDNTDVTLYDPSWGAAHSIGMTDIQVPKVWLMQALSKLVDAGEAKQGEFRDSIDATLLGDAEHPVELIIFDFKPHWQVFRRQEPKPKFVRREEFNGQTARAEYEWIEDGQECFRQKAHEYWALVVLDGKPLPIPYVVTLARKASPTAQKLNTMIMRLCNQGKNSAAMTFLLGCEKQENEYGKFFVPTVKLGRATTRDEIVTAKKWFDDISSGKVKATVHEDELATPSTEPTVKFDDDDIPF